MEIKTAYYRERKGPILGLAEGYYSEAAEAIRESRGAEAAVSVRRAADAWFGRVLAELPDIGGDANPLIWSYISSAVSLGFFLAAREHGIPPDEAGRIHYCLIEAFYLSAEGGRSFRLETPDSLSRQRAEMSAASGKGLSPESWVSVYLEPGQAGCDIAWDNSECGNLKLYRRYDAHEFVPYLCMVDAITYPLRGLGLVRTRTLVESDLCDFRVTLGGATRLEPFAEDCLRRWGKAAVPLKD